MKTIKKVPVEPVYVDGFMPEYETFEDGKIYVSKQYSVAIHRCLCGCGAKTVTPLHPVHGWQLADNDGEITMTPSVGNYQMPCKSHYIITNGKANFV